MSPDRRVGVVQINLQIDPVSLQSLPEQIDNRPDDFGKFAGSLEWPSFRGIDESSDVLNGLTRAEGERLDPFQPGAHGLEIAGALTQRQGVLSRHGDGAEGLINLVRDEGEK